MRLQRVVIGMDFSGPAIAAAAWTARRFAPDAELVLVHVIVVPEVPRYLRRRMPPTETLIETVRLGAAQRMRELTAAFGGRLVWPEIRVGTAAEQIAEACSEYDADLVVVGRHGERPGGEGRIGTTTAQLVRIASVPVLLAADIRDAPPERILVPVNDSHVAPWVVAWARFLRERFQARATALHVVGSAMFSSVLGTATIGDEEGAPLRDELRTGLRQEAESWLAQLVRGDVHREVMPADIAFGDPGAEIVGAAHRMHADCIVMGSRGLTGIRRVMLGSVADHVLRHAPCPVLVVKEPADEIAS